MVDELDEPKNDICNGETIMRYYELINRGSWRHTFFWMDSEMMEKVCTVMKIKACRI
jgi:hypothetical protein